jgi:hypothetical protein
MVSFVIPFSAITHNPTAKTLTLAAPYNTITAEKVLSIYNLTKGFSIYNYLDPKRHNSFTNTAGPDISITGGVITYTTNTTSANTDIIQIVVDGAIASSNGSATAIPIYSGQAVAASGSISTSSTPTDVSAYSILHVEMSNGGASTLCTVTVKGKFEADDTLYSTLAIRTLGATGERRLLQMPQLEIW